MPWFWSGLALLQATAVAFKADDNTHYLLKYSSEELPKDAEDTLSVMTANNERYVCAMPKVRKSTETYMGPSPAELLAPIYEEKACSYRAETYWTYELCHGRYLLQYHDERESKIKRTEYYLGNYQVDYTTLDSKARRETDMNPPKRKIDGQELAYYTVTYRQGTTCDITGKPRVTNVLYVCDPNPDARLHQIYSLSETSSCHYEVIVLTDRLCSHPAYEPAFQEEQEIVCYDLDKRVKPKPLSLIKHEEEEAENFKKEYRFMDDILRQLTPQLKLFQGAEPFQSEATTAAESASKLPKFVSADAERMNAALVEDTVQRILSGKECIHGGAGWWHYEFCYEPNGGPRTEILLGVWDEVVHKKWIEQHPHKKPHRFEGSIFQASTLYTKGDICDETKAHRSVEVRLRCKRVDASRLAIALSLTEPSVCQYVLTVESERFCEPLMAVDDYGIIDIVKAQPKKTVP